VTRPTKKTKQRTRQGKLPFRQHGGARKGAGRKPKRGVAGVAHRPRAARASRHPVHVTVKLRQHLPRLRQKAEYAALRAAFVAGGNRFGFRLCHYAILNDHLHFLVEAADRGSLRRGMQGLVIRIARALNKLWRRKGKVFADRYHDRDLTSPREVRNALVYVMGNARKHAVAGRMVRVPQAIDTYTSAPWFDGFRERERELARVRGLGAVVRPVADARTWLLKIGWRRLGLVGIDELPAIA
jgi:REP element-mobilizing transposase RayT